MRCKTVKAVLGHLTDGREEVQVFVTRTKHQSGLIKLSLKPI
jgi:hypothetical protein